MELIISEKKTVSAKLVKIHMKVCDSFAFDIEDDNGKTLWEQEDGYVPAFMPGDHYGDYLILDIDIETGSITNWKKNVPTLYQDVLDAE